MCVIKGFQRNDEDGLRLLLETAIQKKKNYAERRLNVYGKMKCPVFQFVPVASHPEKSLTSSSLLPIKYFYI